MQRNCCWAVPCSPLRLRLNRFLHPRVAYTCCLFGGCAWGQIDVNYHVWCAAGEAHLRNCGNTVQAQLAHTPRPSLVGSSGFHLTWFRTRALGHFTTCCVVVVLCSFTRGTHQVLSGEGDARPPQPTQGEGGVVCILGGHFLTLFSHVGRRLHVSSHSMPPSYCYFAPSVVTR